MNVGMNVDVLTGVVIGFGSIGAIWIVAWVCDIWLCYKVEKLISKKMESYEYHKQISELIKELIPLELSKQEKGRSSKKEVEK